VFLAYIFQHSDRNDWSFFGHFKNVSVDDRKMTKKQVNGEAKDTVAAESLPRSEREIYQCYIKLVDEIQRTESSEYTIAPAYEREYTLDFGSDPAGVKLYLDHRLELNGDLKVRTVCWIVKLPSNFMQCGAKF